MTIPVLYLTVSAARPVYLRMVGSHPDRRDIVYFDRKYSRSKGKFKGIETFEFPLPLIGKDGVKVQVSNALTGSGKYVAIIQERIDRKDIKGLMDAKTETKSFLQFAAKFVAECGGLSEGQYKSEEGGHLIWLRNQIRRHDNNRLIHTPARISFDTGHVEVSKEEFLPLTLPNRFFILCHEHYHVLGNTTDELACDRFAINACLRLGFSKTECLYSLYRLFAEEREDLPPRSRAERERRVARARDIIAVYP